MSPRAFPRPQAGWVVAAASRHVAELEGHLQTRLLNRTIRRSVSGRLHSNNGHLLAPEVRAGRLVPLLQDFVAPPMPIFAVYPSRKHLSAKVRLFVEFVIERFSHGQDWSRP